MTLAAFLRAELAPAPRRAAATARIVVTALVATAAALVFRIPHAAWMIITIVTVSQANAGASWTKAGQRVAGTFAGGGAAILAIALAGDAPWLMMPLVGMVGGLALFLSRTTTAPYAGLLAGITFAILLFQGDDPEASVHTALWRIAAIGAGSALAAAAQLWLWPDDPEAMLLADVAGRLRTAARHVRAAAAGRRNDAAPSVLAVSGLTRELDLLQHAEALTPSLRHRHAEQAALVTAVDCAVTAALAVAALPRPGAAVDAATAARLTAIADESERLAVAAETRGAPAAVGGSRVDDPGADVRVSRLHLAGVVELERSLAAARAALASLHAGAVPGAAVSPLDVHRVGLLTAGFSLANAEALRFAFKGGLAAMVAWVLYQGMGWPGISTCVATTLLVAQSSVGAGQHKALLRVAGAVLGGVLAWMLIVGVVPSLRGPVGWLAALAVPYAVAAWIAVGSSRIAYVGIQAALASALVLLDGFGPVTDLVHGRDRVLGIVLGIAVMTLIDRTIWPVWSSRETARHLAAALRAMARLALAGVHGRDGALLIAPAQGFRQAIYRELTTALQHRDEAHLEPGAPATADERAHVVRLLGEAQTAFLDLLALVRHRIDVVLDAVTEPVRAPLRELGEALAGTLAAVADGVEAGAVAPVPNLGAALTRARTAAGTASAPLDPAMRAHLEARLALYERVAASVGGLAADAQAGIVPAPVVATPGVLTPAPA